MYRVLVFLACLAVGFGANNTTDSSVIYSSPTPFLLSTSMVATASMSMIVSSTSSSMLNMSTSMISPVPTSTMSTTSTPAPKPTSTPAPKPTATPTKPTFGDYSVMKDNKYCLLAKLAVSFEITYNQTEKKPNKTIVVQAVTKVNMPFGNVLTNKSECGSNNSTLVVSWPKTNPSYVFTMKFGRTKDEKNVTGWDVTAVSLNAQTTNNTDFINATDLQLRFDGNTTDLKYLSGYTNGSYSCGIGKNYPFNKNGMMMIKYAKLQPFDVPKKEKEEFGEEKNCESPTKKPSTDSNIVPIAVGCALAGLVLIVLIAYIIGRRKSQRGYEKV